MFMGFILHIYIIFGTNLLTGGPARIAVFFCLFQYFEGKEYQTESKRNKPSEAWFLERTWSRGLGPYIKTSTRRARGRGARLPPRARPPPSWAPCCSTDVLLPPIYVHGPQKHPGVPRNTISTAVTFCIREIPSWSLHRHSAGGVINHEGPLHQHPCPSDELWVVYHRPSGP